MRPTALIAYPPWIGKYEGLRLSDGTLFQWLGLDEEGRPVTAYGCDLPSPAAMNAIVWRLGTEVDSPVASSVEVEAEWERVRSMQSHKGEGAASPAFRDSARLFYDINSMSDWVDRKIAALEAELRKHIPNWDSLGSIVQMARMRTEWAEGDEPWPKLDAAIARGDWTTAADECMPGDLATQTQAYRDSYADVLRMYQSAAQYPGDELPDWLMG